jgi:hypothetical protein
LFSAILNRRRLDQRDRLHRRDLRGMALAKASAWVAGTLALAVLATLCANQPGWVQWVDTVMHPERFHGHRRQVGSAFFEGWYYKFTAQEETPGTQPAPPPSTWAVIPGVFYGAAGLGDQRGSTAFVMVVDTELRQEHWFPFPHSAFQAREDRFEVTIGDNSFSRERMRLNLSRYDAVTQSHVSVVADLRFSQHSPWPVSWLRPGVMGWFAWLPLMECYHGIVSMHSRVDGTFVRRTPTAVTSLAVKGGVAYLEKDWGTNFPRAYVWISCSHFGALGTASESGRTTASALSMSLNSQTGSIGRHVHV